MTVPEFRNRKQSGDRLVVLTAYDAPMARLFSSAGVDALLVGDSVGTTVQGLSTTLAVTLDHLVYHTQLVARGAVSAHSNSGPLVIADMPFLSATKSIESAIDNAGRLIQEGNAGAVKIEGGDSKTCATIAALIHAEIPVMGHIGLRPQSILQMGTYKVQRDEKALVEEAKALEQAGVFSIVLEGMPATIAQAVTAAIQVPTIGIGAGVHCDGQVLVWHDLLGMNPDFKPKFVKPYAQLHQTITQAVRQFSDDVRAKTFPDDAHSYK